VTRGARRALLLAVVVAVALLSAGCVPDAVTEQGRGVQDLYRGFLAVAAVVALVVYGLTIFAIVRYRRRGRDELPPQRTGDMRLEVLWTVVPVMMVIGLFVATLVVLNKVDARDPSATEVHVEAHRWGWTFTYVGTNVTVSGNGEPGPRVVLPVGRPVRIVLDSADVVHAFFVPQFLFKRDAIPGRTTSFDFTIAEPGTYGGQCAEFCGIFHSQMPFTVVAESGAEFDAWLQAAEASAPPAASAAPVASSLATEVPKPVGTASPEASTP
jgi:cytochrome c oxidase subunit 2